MRSSRGSRRPSSRVKALLPGRTQAESPQAATDPSRLAQLELWKREQRLPAWVKAALGLGCLVPLAGCLYQPHFDKLIQTESVFATHLPAACEPCPCAPALGKVGPS